MSSGWDHEDDDDKEADLLARKAAAVALQEGTMRPEAPVDVTVIEGDCPYSREQISEMQLSGVDKPADCSWGDWVGPKFLSQRHDYMVQLAASGMRNKDIAAEMGMTEGRVSILLSNSQMKAAIKKRQDQLWGDDSTRRFKDILKKAIDTAEDILSEEGTKDSLRADIAFRFMDRALGKPKQEVSVEGNLLADLMHRLDNQDAGGLKEKTVNSEKDDVDEFVDGFVPENFTIGKRTGGYE